MSLTDLLRQLGLASPRRPAPTGYRAGEQDAITAHVATHGVTRVAPGVSGPPSQKFRAARVNGCLRRSIGRSAQSRRAAAAAVLKGVTP